MVNLYMPFSRGKIVAVVNVSPGGASVAILSNPKDSAATILAQGASALSLETRTEEQEKRLVGEHIKEATAQALKLYADAGHKEVIHECVIVMHAPWTVSRFLILEHGFDKETKVQDELIAGLARESLKGANIDMARLLESSVVQVALNGYPTPSPQGKYAHALRVTSIVSEGDAAVKMAVEGALHQNFPVATLVWRSGLRALLAIARGSVVGDSFLVVDVGGDDTHVISYRAGDVEQLIVPEGVRTVLARVGANKPPDEVMGLIRMLARDACSSEACDAIRASLATAEPDIVRAIGEPLAKIATANKLPNNAILICHPDMENWFASLLARIDFAQFTVTSMPLTVHTAASLDIGKWVAGAQTSDPIIVACALVNIESRS